jgi:predicted CopG family antitoxin
MVENKKSKKYEDKLTTIALPMKVKDELQEFGSKGESYSDIIERLLESARQRLLQDVLMNSEGFIPIEEAIKEAEKKWPK